MKSVIIKIRGNIGPGDIGKSEKADVYTM